MHLKNIPRHGLLKYYTVVFLILFILESLGIFFIHFSCHEKAKSDIALKTVEVEGLFKDQRINSERELNSKIRSYIKNFKDKDLLEIAAFNNLGEKIATSSKNSTAFLNKPYINNEKNYPYCKIQKLNNQTHAMVLTRSVKDSTNNICCYISYVYSLAPVDNAIFFYIIISLIIVSVMFILLFILNKIFMKSILKPIREVSKTSRKIALGDFKARLTTRYDGDIGELCDTVNFMAQKLDESEKMKNDFISSVSHELRTPLTAIKGWAETIQLGGEKEIEMNKRGLNIIIHEAERLCGIVEELLDFSRMQSGRMILNLEKIDILAELSEAVYIFKERALEEKKMLLYSDPELLAPVLGDKNRLRQVFINILDNALKYTQENGVINVAAKEEDNFVVITISDNGCGIPLEHMPKIKDKFYKANMTQKGSGIGLAISNEIILLHSGTLNIQSEENIGTVVTISVPEVHSSNEI